MQQNMVLLKEEEEHLSCKNTTRYYNEIENEDLEDIIHKNRFFYKAI